MKVQRCNFIPENEIGIIKDLDTLIHNIVTPELKELQQENKQLKSILTELGEWLDDKSNNDKYGMCFYADTLDKIEELEDKYKYYAEDLNEEVEVEEC